jgi:hypothetical protein
MIKTLMTRIREFITRGVTVSVLNIAIFFLLPKPVAQKVKMDWNFSTMSSMLCVALVVISVELCSLSMFCFT